MSLLDKINNVTSDYTHEPVPLSERRGSFALFTVWFVVMVNLIFIFFGVNISRGMPIDQAILACITGQGIAAVMLGITAIFAAKVNLSSAVLVPHVFGSYVGTFIIAMIGLMGVCFFGFQLELFSQSLARLIGWPEKSLIFIVSISGLMMISSAVIGFKAIDWISRVATPFLIILLAVPTIDYFLHGGSLSALSDTELNPDNAISFGTAVSILLGGLSVPLLVTADIMRFAKNATQSFWVTFVGQTFGALIIIVLAIFLGRISAEPDFISIIAAAGFGGFGLLLIMLATWTTNDTNIYISSLAFSRIFRMRKWMIALACGIAGIVVGLLGIVDNFMQFLGLMGTLFGPIGAVFQIGIFQRLGKVDFAKDQVKAAVKWDAFVAIVLGFAVSLMTSNTDSLGLELFTLTAVPMIDGYLIAGLIYFSLSFVNTKRKIATAS
jgi:cytosine permease